MELKVLKPRKALNKAFLKVKPNRAEIEGFKTNLITLLDRTNDTESEEFHKNLVSDFLKHTYYKRNHFINTKGRNDLVIHNGQHANSTVGVILETKKPTNKGEMVTSERLNVKAFQELVLYYLRERITHNNLEVKHLIITNINEWFIFDATLFDRLFAQNKPLVKQFNDFEGGRLADTKTDFFYKEIAKPFIANITAEIEFTHFNIQDFQKPLRNADNADDSTLISLFKLLSPEHLLKLPFTNDSNSLDKRFYSEFLHIIGLTETKEGGKRLIGRKKEGERDTGSILEDTIIQLDSLDKIARLDRPAQFGTTQQERLFSVALELTITWINRILFLKLLEAQLITYHKGDKSYSFLNLGKIKSYDDLNSLFFQVLARKYNVRNEDVQKAFVKVPYLNSSLFEPTHIEHSTIFISNLRNEKSILIFSQTVLKDERGKRLSGEMPTLAYLFRFLDAYDFGAEGGEEIQEENKTLINASVLGLIFEKINGYKEGSIFTPGFVTMYMSRETVRRAVVQKFNEAKGWNCKSFEELKEDLQEEIRAGNRKDLRKLANSIINSLRIIDPAVGSGHFLVSVLNELIAVKSELRILVDVNYEPLSYHTAEVVNDELIVTDEDGILFQYNPNNKESQRIQETLFHEKQTIIENCLFGVDINPNSVKICRLRLWIELLKNACYKNSTELETLPNIDINIKCGNSLVSRFAIDADLSEALRKSRYSIDSYRMAVTTYRNAQNKEEKREMERLILEIKQGFSATITMNNPLKKRLDKLASELYHRFTGTFLFEPANDYGNNKIEKKRQQEQKKLESEIETLSKKIDEIKESKVYNESFEWRFEFPEVLNDDGTFEGFDLVIGNPPYIRIQDLMNSEQDIVSYLNKAYESTGKGNYDIYIPFIELGYKLLKTRGQLAYIMPHKFLNANYGVPIREFLRKNTFPTKIVHFGSSQVFEDATTYTGIFFMTKGKNDGVAFLNWPTPHEVLSIEESLFDKTSYASLGSEPWEFLGSQELQVMNSLKRSGLTLESIADRIFQGLKTSADKIYIVKKLEETETTYKVYSDAWNQEFELEKTFLFPLIKGGNSRPFRISETELLILFPYQDGKLVELDNLEKAAPNIFTYLKQNKEFLENRENQRFKGESWHQYGRSQAIDIVKYPKIFTPDIAPSPRFSYDQNGRFMFTGGAAGGYGIVPKEGVSSYFLLGILNSSVTEWFMKLTSTQMRGGWLSFESRYIKNIPMPSNLESKELEDLVLLATKMEAYDGALKNQIDKLVYRLYGLTEEEIKIMEDS
ncbi:putative type IIS restriction/modification enzyme [Lunatimonas lonarensis]|uniref:site-specific DNA-methyltransferase (adenine-specific) n=1 Tax=Lunatimonas lonarensis TaxID=1232681 RepID=R7ZMA4_9BACT|nr:Eco57I restriction-modification methylase domain-containing protein [Lunatimonas lonarensis]EON75230.1 putative type IIS restriction/modification enzyme [Lunatimonas lonarensis]